MFIGSGVEVYEGMIVGENSRSEDMNVNPTKEKKQTNVRSETAEVLVRLIPPRELSLEQALEFIRDEECAEVTPKAVRLRKLLQRPAWIPKRCGLNCGPPPASHAEKTPPRPKVCGSSSVSSLITGIDWLRNQTSRAPAFQSSLTVLLRSDPTKQICWGPFLP